jgi:hypothetical protein
VEYIVLSINKKTLKKETRNSLVIELRRVLVTSRNRQRAY